MKKSRKDWLIENNHKVLLIVLLVALAVVCIQQIISMEYPRIVLLKGENVGEMVDDLVIPEINSVPVTLSETNTPYTPGKYIYCRNLECNFLVHQSRFKCPWCMTPVKFKTPPPKNDLDDDKIPDKIEVALGLDPNNPEDALEDLDDDGFNNLWEFRSKHNMKDPNDHPSLIYKTVFIKAQNIYYPMSVATIETGKCDPDNPGPDLHKKSWDIYADIFTSRRKSTYYKIGDVEKETGYKLIDVGLQGNKPFAVFKKSAEPAVTVFPKEPRKVHYTVFIFKNTLTGKIIRVRQDEDFNLNNKNGQPERFRLREYLKVENAVNIRLYSEDFIIKMLMGILPRTSEIKKD